MELYAPGEKTIYDILNVTFIVDAEMLSWLEVHDWLRAVTFPTEYEEYQNLSKLNQFASAIPTKTPQYSDGAVTILSASNKPYYRFNFKDLFPISLSGFLLWVIISIIINLGINPTQKFFQKSSEKSLIPPQTLINLSRNER